MAKTLRLILGDQLNAGHSWFEQVDDEVVYLIAELHQECTYVHHHIQKICGFFAAMHNFAKALRTAGHQVHYLTLDDTADFADLNSLIKNCAAHFQIEYFEFQSPDEYRVRQQLLGLDLGPKIQIREFDSEHFLVPFEQIETWFSPKRAQRMETFYRKMRRQLSVLMDGDQPTGGQWNFDQDNRQVLRKKDLVDIPAPLLFANDVKAILARLKRHDIDTFGTAQEQLIWPTSRTQAEQLLAHFCEHCLPNFGRFQDAMTGNSEHAWSLYHARLSFALNCKMLHPRRVIGAAIETWKKHSERIDLAQVEGFVRQIMGWREFVRGVYWSNMPEYAQLNALQAKAELPGYFWSGKTRMACMSQVIGQSLQWAYAHHIQRLMITGNFCLLTGINPDAVDRWYLGIYMDALEWVEMPNTRGMSQFADGGLLASKPYAASANYIHKMSDYCGDCHYRHTEKTGSDACPFNSLYWHFIDRHQARLSHNPRTAMICKSWSKQAPEQRQEVLERASWCLQHLNEL